MFQHCREKLEVSEAAIPWGDVAAWLRVRGCGRAGTTLVTRQGGHGSVSKPQRLPLTSGGRGCSELRLAVLCEKLTGRLAWFCALKLDSKTSEPSEIAFLVP